MEDRISDHEAWPARAAMLALLGAVLGLILDFLIDYRDHETPIDILRVSAASFIAVAGITFAFTLERVRWLWSLLFGLGSGLVAGFIFYWNGSPEGWSAGDGWRLFSALLAIAIAAPLFQAVRDEGRWDLRPGEVHAHAWTSLVLWVASWAFVGISWLLAQLLAELFSLIGITLLREALRESAVNLMIVGGALGAAVGLLRDRDKVLGLLQRVATTVLSVLAPVLAAGLVLFVLALPFTGLEPLWDKTSSTTPIILIAIAGAFFLANAVIGNSAEEEAQGKVLRWSAMALAAVMAPLAAVAALSTWLRIDQHGFTPERLWALTFVLLVLAVALAYLWSLVRGRSRWSERIRPANVRLHLHLRSGAAAGDADHQFRCDFHPRPASAAAVGQGEAGAVRLGSTPLRLRPERTARARTTERRGLAAARRARFASARRSRSFVAVGGIGRVDSNRRARANHPGSAEAGAAARTAFAGCLPTATSARTGTAPCSGSPGADEAIAIGFGCATCRISATGCGGLRRGHGRIRRSARTLLSIRLSPAPPMTSFSRSGRRWRGAVSKCAT
jgi:hypothetical protein